MGILAITSNVDMCDLKREFNLKKGPFKDVLKNITVKIPEYPRERDPVFCLSERIESIKTTIEQQSKVFENDDSSSISWAQLSRFLVLNCKTWDLKSPWKLNSNNLVRELGALVRETKKSKEDKVGSIMVVPEIAISLSKSSMNSHDDGNGTKVGSSSCSGGGGGNSSKSSTEERVKWSKIDSVLSKRAAQWCLWERMRDNTEEFISKILKANDRVDGSLSKLKESLGSDDDDLGETLSNVLDLDREVETQKQRRDKDAKEKMQRQSNDKDAEAKYFDSDEEEVPDIETGMLRRKLFETEVEFRSLMIRCIKETVKIAVVCNDLESNAAQEIASTLNCAVIDLEEIVRDVSSDASKTDHKGDDEKEENEASASSSLEEMWSEKAKEAAKTLHKLKSGLTLEAIDNNLKHVTCLVKEKIKRVEKTGRGWILKNFPLNTDHLRALKREGVSAEKIIIATVEKREEKEEEEEEEIPFASNHDENIIHLNDFSSSSEVCVKTLRSLENWIDPRDRELQENDIEVPNAFAVTLFCMDQEHEWRASEFLRHAFDCYPDLQYCLVTLPCTSPESALLRSFSSVQSNSSSHVLYLLRRDAMNARTSLNVERCEKGISEQYIKEVFGENQEQKIWRDALDSADEFAYVDLVNHPKISSFVIRCHGKSIGLCVLDSSKITDSNLEKLNETYRLESIMDLNHHVTKEQSVISHFIIDKVYERRSRFVLQEIMRVCSISVLYARYDQNVPKSFLMRDFQRVRPHHVAQGAERKKKEEAEKGNEENVPLFVLPQRLLSEPKIQCNARIVIVGASDSGLAALETISYLSDVNFTNLTLVSASGMPKGMFLRFERGVCVCVCVCNVYWIVSLCCNRCSSFLFIFFFSILTHFLSLSFTQFVGTRDEGNDASDILSPYSSYSEKEIMQLRLDISTRVVSGNVVEIDRERKDLILLSQEQNQRISYDVLLISTGLQDSTEKHLRFEFQKALHDASKSLDDDVLRLKIPRGTCFLTDKKSEEDALKLLSSVSSSSDSKVIVYGSALSAMSIIEVATKQGIEAKRIIWVNPRSDSKFLDDSCSDVKTEEYVSDILERLGVTVRFGLELVSMESHGGEDSKVESSVFASQVPENIKSCLFRSTSDQKLARRDLGNPLLRTLMEPSWLRSKHVENVKEVKKRQVQIECSALLCASKSAVNTNIVRAVKESGLVFDGTRIVVDHHFRTLDPCIYATGSASRFSRRFRAKFDLKDLNSREIGVAAAHSILESINPILETRNAYVHFFVSFVCS